MQQISWCRMCMFSRTHNWFFWFLILHYIIPASWIDIVKMLVILYFSFLYFRVVCKCGFCGTEKQQLSDWERHTGSKVKNWKKSIRVKDSMLTLEQWVCISPAMFFSSLWRGWDLARNINYYVKELILNVEACYNILDQVLLYCNKLSGGVHIMLICRRKFWMLFPYLWYCRASESASKTWC